ncbi:MAG: outer membrane protein assembly factor BamD [Gemmatimonadota bacterium]
MRSRVWGPRRTVGGVAVLALAAALAACSNAIELADLPADDMYARGQQELDEGNWNAAITVFERFSLEFPTHPLMERARFGVGQAFFGKKEYLTASTEFLRLVQDYPVGELADDARFMVCRAYEELSPEIPLDQEYTRGAVEHCDALAEFYPGSEYADSARSTRDRLVDKLAQKDLYSADFYFRNKAYDSAIVYLEDLLEGYPTSTVAPQALLMLVEIYGELGYQSELDDVRGRLLRDFPESPEAEAAQAWAQTGSSTE